MNRFQRVAVWIAAGNLLLILLIPPFDQHTIATALAPAFAGFYFAFNPPLYGQINESVLVLEALVVLINTGIAWLLLRDRGPAAGKSKLSLQSAVLIGIGANLVLMLLFPPFASVFTVTNAVLPSFEGFYFIFQQQPNHAIVTSLLYIEVVFILVNGALFWLLLNEQARSSARD